MKVDYLKIVFLIISLLSHLSNQERTNEKQSSRRILHQPLFPVSSEPPPATEQPPPLPPPDNVNSGQPFFPEVPTTPNPDQTQPPPPPPPPTASPANETALIPTATQPSKHAKTLVIVISVGVVTFGVLSALAFFLYRHRVKQQQQQQQPSEGVGKFSRERNNSNNVSFDDESRIPPSSMLYFGTVDPSRVPGSESNDDDGGDDDVNESPYSKLNNSAKRSDRYRPSPDLQPLPPLSKAAPVHDTGTSSDEESYDATFYTPQGSSVGPEDGIYTPVSRLNSVSTGKCDSSVPHSKRTSPKSRILGSSPDVKNVIIPSIKHAPSYPPQPFLSEIRTASLYPPTRPKFSAPPPPPDLARLRSISNSTPPPPPPPPPPPRPPALSTSKKVGGDGVSTLSKEQHLTPNGPQLNGLSPKVATRSLSSSRSGSGNGSANCVNGEDSNGAGFSEKVGVDDGDCGRPKLKPLHWDKVRASSDRATVWDQLNAGSFQLNEDRIESLFGCNSANSVPKGVTRKSVLPPVEKENRVLDPKKSQNIAILLRALNVTRDEVSEALLDGHPESLGADLLETLVKMAPTKEEEIKLRNYNGDISKLGSAERFLKAILDIPFSFKRVEAMLYRANFDGEVKYLRKSFETLEAACQELKNSKLFLKLLEAVLRTGNRMNVGTNRGDAKSFKLDTLLKLVDVKGTDGKTTLLHFVVQEIIRSQGANNGLTDGNKTHSTTKLDDFRKEGLQVVAGLSRDLGNVKKAAGMDSDVLSNYVSKLEKGLEKVRAVLQYENPDMQGNFFISMKTFLDEAEEGIAKIKIDEKRALSLVKDVTEYFHGDAGKEEAHPLRIFMIVRDFLSILDNVCKDVGMLQDYTMVGSARSFRISAATLPVLNRYNVRQDISSDEESSSS